MSLDSPRPRECPRLREYGYSTLARRRVQVDGRRRGRFVPVASQQAYSIIFGRIVIHMLDSIKLTNVRVHNLRGIQGVGVCFSRAFLTEGSFSIVSSSKLIVASAVHQVQALLAVIPF